MLKLLVKLMVFSCLIALLFLYSKTLAQPISQEKSVVCIYYKRLEPNNPSAGYLMKLINRSTTSGQFILRTSPEPYKAVYVDIGKAITPNDRDVVERNLAARIGDMFSAKSDKSLKTVAEYKELLKLISENDRIFKQVDLSKNFDIKDTVYLFDFDAAAQNYSVFKNNTRPEALALYQFVDERWTGQTFYADYKLRISKHDFKGFLEPEILEAIFQTRQLNPESNGSTYAQKRLLSDADQKATWALILSIISIITGIFGLLTNTLQGKDKDDQLRRVEGKIKLLESRLNKPFYQTDISSEEARHNTQQIQNIISRIVALERATGISTVNHINKPLSFSNDTAKKLYELTRLYREKWSSEQSLSSVYGELILCLDDFASHLPELDNGMLTQDFVAKHAIPHIDALDALFRPEPDAPLNTPESVNEYIRELQKILEITEIEIRTKVSRFDNERHEKAGAILKTNLEPGTITKVLRRGLIHGAIVRKAQVIRAE